VAGGLGGQLARGHKDEVLEASRVSRFAITSPTVARSAAAASAVALFEAAFLAFGPPRLALETALLAALLGSLMPAALFAGLAFAYFRRTGGTITRGRSAALAVTDVAVVFAFSLVGAFRGPSNDLWAWGHLLGVAFAGSVNMIVLAGTTEPSLRFALLPSLALPAAALGAFATLALAPPDLVFTSAFFVPVFAFSAALWVRVVVTPFRRNFNEDGLGLLHSVLDAWAGWSRAPGSADPALGTLRMEAFFGRHGKAREVGFHAVRFSQVGGRRLLWFTPELHPGPYADLGGSDLPAKAAASLSDLADEVATFHGPSTHDENPTGREELAKVLVRVGPALESAAGGGEGLARTSVRRASAPFQVMAQRVGSHLVIAQSRAPLSSDDIDLVLGRQIEADAKAQGVDEVVLLDGHNAVAADLGRIEAGSAEGGALRRLCAEAVALAGAAPQGALRAGWARVGLERGERLEFAVGSQGVFATVTEVEGQRTAWVLIDGNNMKSGLRAQCLGALEGKVTHAEVFTTDNHAVNTTMGAENEVGSKADNAPLVAWVVEAVDRAVADLQPATASATSARVAGVKVFGPGLTAKISETIRAAVRLMIPAYLITTGGAVAGCLALAVLLT